MKANNVISRDTFISAVDALRNQMELDAIVGEHLEKAFPSAYPASLSPDNSILYDTLINVLSETVGDTDNWVDWFCYETNFGEESYRLRAYDEDGKVIKMDNAGDLYDMLTK